MVRGGLTTRARLRGLLEPETALRRLAVGWQENAVGGFSGAADFVGLGLVSSILGKPADVGGHDQLSAGGVGRVQKGAG
jgi:hypothetical protein